MLWLTRERGEVIVIDHPGGPIRVTIVSVRNGVVRLGFEAPRSVGIWRQEIYEEALRNGTARILPTPDDAPRG